MIFFGGGGRLRDFFLNIAPYFGLDQTFYSGEFLSVCLFFMCLFVCLFIIFIAIFPAFVYKSITE